MTAPTENEPRLRIDLPAGFAGMPITGTEEDVLRSIDGVVARAAENGRTDVDELRTHLTAMTGSLAQQHVRLYGRFAVGGDDVAEPALATLTLAMPELNTTPQQRDLLREQRSAVVIELARAYRERVPHAHVRANRVTLGPAIVAHSSGEYHFSADDTGGKGPMVRPEFKAEFQVPTPDLRRIIILVVVTGNEAAWPLVAAQTRRIADSVRFDPQVERST